jgi:peptidylprolyl isomerase
MHYFGRNSLVVTNLLMVLPRKPMNRRDLRAGKGEGDTPSQTALARTHQQIAQTSYTGSTMTAKLSSIALLAALTAAASAQTTTKKPATAATHHTASTATTTPPNIPKVVGIPKILYALRYIDTQIGTGALAESSVLGTSAADSKIKWYTVRYTGWLTDGTKFDSSYDHPGAEPISFPAGAHQVIPGWDTGFQGMHVGGKRRLFIPYQLAYGEAGKLPRIPAKADLIFDIELVSMSDTRPAPRTPPAAPADPGAAPDKPAASPEKPATAPPPADPTKPETTPHPQSL